MATKVQGGFDRKVPNGKFIRIRVELETGNPPKLVSVRVYGDFFMHPEKLIEDIEASLLGSGGDAERAKVQLHDLFGSPGVSVFGAGPEDFIVTFRSALADARTKAGVP